MEVPSLTILEIIDNNNEHFLRLKIKDRQGNITEKLLNNEKQYTLDQLKKIILDEINANEITSLNATTIQKTIGQEILLEIQPLPDPIIDPNVDPNIDPTPSPVVKA